MELVVLILRQVVGTGLLFMQIILFVQAILSFVIQDASAENRLFDWINAAGDAITAPVRAVMERFAFARNSPLDLSFLVTVMILAGLRMVIV